MRVRAVVMLSLSLLLSAAGCADPGPAPVAGPVGDPAGPWREQMHWIPTTDDFGATALMQARICVPPGAGPFRVAILAHGAPPAGATARARMRPWACGAAFVRWFLDRGTMVVIGMRRGYGESGGDFAEDTQGCTVDGYTHAGQEAARDLAAQRAYAASLPLARPDGAIIVGQSAGGWATLAYDAAPHPGVAAFIAMAPGHGGHYHMVSYSNCHPENLEAAAGRFGRTATTPVLIVYAENDTFFPPPIAAALVGDFTAAGGRADFHALGPFETDGHLLFTAPAGPPIWGPLAAAYLMRMGIDGVS